MSVFMYDMYTVTPGVTRDTLLVIFVPPVHLSKIPAITYPAFAVASHCRLWPGQNPHNSTTCWDMLSPKQLNYEAKKWTHHFDRTLASPTSETVTTKRSPRSTCYVNKIGIQKAFNGNAMKLASLKILGLNSHDVQLELTISMAFRGPGFWGPTFNVGHSINSATYFLK